MLFYMYNTEFASVLSVSKTDILSTRSIIHVWSRNCICLAAFLGQNLIFSVIQTIKQLNLISYKWLMQELNLLINFLRISSFPIDQLASFNDSFKISLNVYTFLIFYDIYFIIFIYSFSMC